MLLKNVKLIKRFHHMIQNVKGSASLKYYNIYLNFQLYPTKGQTIKNSEMLILAMCWSFKHLLSISEWHLQLVIDQKFESMPDLKNNIPNQLFVFLSFRTDVYLINYCHVKFFLSTNLKALGEFQEKKNYK